MSPNQSTALSALPPTPCCALPESPNDTLNELHLFAGCGGGILGGILCGHRPVCAVEIEPYARRVLLQRQRDGLLPWFPIWDDVTTFDGRPWRGKAHVVCGGFPCQDISVANAKAEGIDGERSGLWKEMARIIGEVVPRFVFVENSPALLIRGMGTVLGDLAAMGYDARWGVFSAADVGAPHIRERVWILAHTHEVGTEIREFAKPRRPLSRDWVDFPKPAQLDAESPILRVDDGMADWMDRLAAIGNGQVPTVAAFAWRMLHGDAGSLSKSNASGQPRLAQGDKP